VGEIHSRRRDGLRSAVDDLLRDTGGFTAEDAVLVTSLIDVRWLTGFTGSHGCALVMRDGAVIASDGRYVDQIAAEVDGLDVVITRSVQTDLARLAHDRKARRLIIDETSVTLAQARALHGVADATQGSLSIAEHALPLSTLRMVKDATEVSALREACRLSDEALAHTIKGQIEGLTERDVAIRLERRMIDLGAEAIAFDTIVAAGENSAIPHHQPTGRVIRRGDLLKIDFGARVDGYHADETRTFVIGPPAPWQQEVHGIVREAQAAGVAALRPGVALADVDAAARSIIEAAGYGDRFTHGLGHGVGLVIHEEPFFTSTATGILTAGIPLTVEPGIYLPGRGGVRIEDTLLVGAEGAESLTETPRDLVVLG
jgi:Xaa-Pro aminopeptidase